MANLQVGKTPVRYTGNQIENAYFCLTDMCKGMEAEPGILSVTGLGIVEQSNL